MLYNCKQPTPHNSNDYTVTIEKLNSLEEKLSQQQKVIDYLREMLTSPSYVNEPKTPAKKKAVVNKERSIDYGYSNT